jgi:hypothetical protein
VISLESYRRGFYEFGCDPDQICYVSDDSTLRTHKINFREAQQGDHWNYPLDQAPIPELFYPFLSGFS